MGLWEGMGPARRRFPTLLCVSSVTDLVARTQLGSSTSDEEREAAFLTADPTRAQTASLLEPVARSPPLKSRQRLRWDHCSSQSSLARHSCQVSTASAQCCSSTPAPSFAHFARAARPHNHIPPTPPHSAATHLVARANAPNGVGSESDTGD